MNLKKIIISIFSSFVILFLGVSVLSISQDVYAKEGNPINIYIFHGDTCPHCKSELALLDNLSQKYNFTLISYEVYNNKDNRDLMARFGRAYNTNFNVVPTLIIGYEYIVGEDPAGVERLIKQYGSQQVYIDPMSILAEYEKTNKIDNNVLNNKNTKKIDSLKIFGKEITLDKAGPVIFGILLGLADGINPCMFGVLIFLLTYLISIGSKDRILKSGIIFVISTFAFYFAVMYGMHNLLFNVSVFLPYVGKLKIVIGFLAIILGILEIKDFFFYGQGFSLRIPSFAKPIIELIGKRGTYFSAFLLALFSSIVELPCTIGIPLTYIAATEKSMNIFSSLLVYNIAFIIPLIIIIGGVYLSADKVSDGQKLGVTQERYKKIMRLVAGLVLLTMGILLITGIV